MREGSEAKTSEVFTEEVMPRTLQNDLDKNIKPWPADWDLHIIKTCMFLFDENDGNSGVYCLRVGSNFRSVGDAPVDGTPTYEMLRENLDLDSIDLRVILEHRDRYYISHFNKGEGHEVVGNLLLVSGYQPDEGNLVVAPVSYISANSGYDCVQKMIEAVVEHGRTVPEDDDSSSSDDLSDTPWSEE